MAITNKKTQLQIEAYLLDKLTGHELRAFENQLATDHELREEVTFQQLLNASICYWRRKQLDLLLREQTAHLPKYSRRQVWVITVSMLATLALIVLIILFWPGSGSSESTFQQPVASSHSRLVIPRHQEVKEATTQLSPLRSNPAFSDTVRGDSASDNGYSIPDNEIIGLADSVKKDYLLFDTILRAGEADSSIFFQTGQIADSHLKNDTMRTPPGRQVLVEVWLSPIHFKGYRLQNYQLILYGMSDLDSVKLALIDKQLYLIKAHEIYELREARQYFPLWPVKTLNINIKE